jgi:hypothetical protein
MDRPSNLTGQDFGRWHVLGPAGHDRHRRRLWHVECSCPRGTRKTMATSDLRKGTSLSCGCFRAEQLAIRNRTPEGKVRKPLPERRCDYCRQSYRPGTRRSKYCSEVCRGKAHWQRIASEPAHKAAHSRKVCDRHKRATYVHHQACANCKQPFSGSPERVYCSELCLDAAIRSGKYRRAFHGRRATMEIAALEVKLKERLTNDRSQ